MVRSPSFFVQFCESSAAFSTFSWPSRESLSRGKVQIEGNPPTVIRVSLTSFFLREEEFSFLIRLLFLRSLLLETP